MYSRTNLWGVAIDKMTHKKALVIGAGIHGISVAIELAKQGREVTIIDAKKDIFLGSSGATHNRIHLGYHYPKSKETALECKNGYYDFIKNYRNCVSFYDFYYAIDKNNSNVSAKKYQTFMEELGLECNSGFPKEYFLNKNQVEDSFKVKEACFDIWKLKEIFKKRLKKLKVKLIYDFEIKKADIKDNKLKLTSSKDIEMKLDVDLIINCTYTYTNNVQIAFSVFDDLTPYKFESTEIAVVESNVKIPAFTVMDGPFMTILPYAGKENHYLVYDKEHSVIKQEIGIEYNPPKTKETNWNKMLKKGLKYHPFFKDLKYKYSIYGSRPISLKTKNDGRTTKIIKHDYPIDFYSILEGKFVSAPLIAKKLIGLLNGKVEGKNALIGHTGFIGSNLKNDFLFDDFYNSKNIKDIEGKEYNLIVSCGNSSTRWKVNQNPKKDLENIKQFIESIKKVKVNKFVLISTIDVLGDLEKNPYGQIRLYLENFIKSHFRDYLIVRLPIVYGHNFKKNIIYDALNNHELNKVNTEAKVQIYNVKNLMKDIQIALKNNLKVLNIATEPIVVKEIYKEVFNLNIDNSPRPKFEHNMKTDHAKLFGKEKDYLYNKKEILNEFKLFKDGYYSVHLFY